MMEKVRRSNLYARIDGGWERAAQDLTNEELRALLDSENALEQTRSECRELALKLFGKGPLDVQDTHNVRKFLEKIGDN